MFKANIKKKINKEDIAHRVPILYITYQWYDTCVYYYHRANQQFDSIDLSLIKG